MSSIAWVRDELTGTAGADAIVFDPPVEVPPGGIVELDCYGDTGIVRVFDGEGNPIHVRLQNVLMKKGVSCHVIQLRGIPS